MAASEKKLAKKAEKTRKKAAKKDFDRRHAQLKRQQTLHSALLASQVKRGKKQARNAADSVDSTNS